MATIASIIKDGIAAGKNTAEILEMVKAQKPEANTSAACIAYYRSKMKKEGGDKASPKAAKPTAKKQAPTAAPSEAAEARSKLLAAVAKQTATATGSSDPIYTVKNIRTFNGMEGSGYNATLYRDGKAVASIIDDASGGCLMVDWKDFKGGEHFVEVSGYDYSGELRTYNGTPEEKILMDFINKLPMYKSEFSDDMFHVTHDVFLDELVNDALLLKRIRKLCSTKIVYVEGSDIYTVKAEPSLANCNKARKEGRVVLNGLDDAEMLKALEATK